MVRARSDGLARAVGDELVGNWSGPAGAKTFPVRLSPGAPWVTRLADAGAGASLSEQAENCLADAACPALEARRLFVAADDAHEDAIHCFRFLDGAGVGRDVARGRACLERRTGRMNCRGASADLAGAELATMRIDGVGGPRDIDGARAHSSLTASRMGRSLPSLTMRRRSIATRRRPP